MRNNIIMHDPVLMEILISSYFLLQKKEDLPPTVPGLALAIGFNRVKDLTDTVKNYDEGSNQYPEESYQVLIRAITKMEELYVQNGLIQTFPAALVKFCLGAYHEVRDKNEENDSGNVQLAIVFGEGDQQSAKLISSKQTNMLVDMT